MSTLRPVVLVIATAAEVQMKSGKRLVFEWHAA
jgi:hypothetical protein